MIRSSSSSFEGQSLGSCAFLYLHSGLKDGYVVGLSPPARSPLYSKLKAKTENENKKSRRRIRVNDHESVLSCIIYHLHAQKDPIFITQLKFKAFSPTTITKQATHPFIFHFFFMVWLSEAGLGVSYIGDRIIPPTQIHIF